jgi:hypothetical protein
LAVVLSMAEHEKLSGLSVREFQRFCDMISERAAARGLTEEKLAELLTN